MVSNKNKKKGSKRKKDKRSEAKWKKGYKKLFGVNPSKMMVSFDTERRKIKKKVNLRRFVRWPEYIRVQRQKRILRKRLRIPPVINQFGIVASKPFAKEIVEFLMKYTPETASEKKKRMEKAATKEEKIAIKKEKFLLYGHNEVVNAIEKRQAKLVVIAHDVDPIEIVWYIPGLCHRMKVPYVIIKSKARLGKIVRKKNTSCLCVVKVQKKDRDQFQKIVYNVNDNFNKQYEARMKEWGGSKLSKEAQFKVNKINETLRRQKEEFERKKTK